MDITYKVKLSPPIDFIEFDFIVPKHPRYEAIHNVMLMARAEFNLSLVTPECLQGLRRFVAPLFERLYHRPVDVAVRFDHLSQLNALVFTIEGQEWSVWC